MQEQLFFCDLFRSRENGQCKSCNVHLGAGTRDSTILFLFDQIEEFDI